MPGTFPDMQEPLFQENKTHRSMDGVFQVLDVEKIVVICIDDTCTLITDFTGKASVII